MTNEDFRGRDLGFPVRLRTQPITHVLIVRAIQSIYLVKYVISDVDKLVDIPVNYFTKYLKNPVDLSLHSQLLTFIRS